MKEEFELQLSEISEGETIDVPEVLPLMAIRDIVLFPSMVVPLFVGRPKSLKAIEEALNKNKLIVLSTQKNSRIENPKPENLYKIGTIGLIIKTLNISEDRLRVVVQVLSRVEIKEFLQTDPYFKVKIEPCKELEPEIITPEIEALMRSVKENIEKLLSLKGNLNPEISTAIQSIEEPGRLADLITAYLKLKVKTAQDLLGTLNGVERLKKVSEILIQEIEITTLQNKIQAEAEEEIGRSQREYFLREQLRAIKRELGEVEDVENEIEELRKKIKKAKMPKNVEKEALKQLNRLEYMHPDSSEAAVIRNYLEWLIELPWNKSTKDNLNLKHVKKILDKDHYNLEKVKDRILEFLAVKKINPKAKGAIICFVGPPGVGKTSLGKSIATALRRKFVRVSLGGIRDEAEIRGHRRTYVGALPGRIIQGIKQAGTNNPVFMLDEIDKLCTDFHGDPAAALLEVLDPEQNKEFVDHFLDVPFDLSKVLFIATANMTEPIPKVLLDRMEVIYISGYTFKEKLEIAKKHLLPKLLKEHGLTKRNINISDEVILKVIEEYTSESGVRELERKLAAICRKITRKLAEGEKGPFKITEENLGEYLGPPEYVEELKQEKDEVGVATGLAWTPYGGEVLYVEAVIMPGKGNLILTGHLGDIMKESAQAALSYIRSKHKELKIDPKFYTKYDIHVHVPSGAIPKDGPSAGITIAVALISALTKKPVSKDYAMTGEITLRGKILPVGGIKEKCLAALRKGIKKVLLPYKNQKDLEEIPKELRDQIEFIFVSHLDEVINLVLKNN
ncbi:MAG: endopeptidase La [Thermodesulfobacterium sp.]|uniref:Lon protease n=1 Tax=Candidatus Thermodesulfobacterium syntrophicum TaxID=3060442 RepID=A0AAE3TED6_9BACT|nr:endopeptidase La [Thermodesulfobacterium sp.]MDF2953351.1 ATP-dependent Lon protease [Candidatus Thermodesulfobacterium syntrophicum]